MKLSTMAPILAWSIILTAPLLMAKEPLEGAWLGHWVRDGSSLEVTMRFSKSEGGCEGSFDSEALRVTGIPIQNITWKPPDVTWKVIGDTTTTIFSDQLRGGAIIGRFKEGDASGSFSFVRSTDAPPPSTREEITFASGDVMLAGHVNELDQLDVRAELICPIAEP